MICPTQIQGRRTAILGGFTHGLLSQLIMFSALLGSGLAAETPPVNLLDGNWKVIVERVVMPGKPAITSADEFWQVRGGAMTVTNLFLTREFDLQENGDFLTHFATHASLPNQVAISVLSDGRVKLTDPRHPDFDPDFFSVEKAPDGFLLRGESIVYKLGKPSTADYEHLMLAKEQQAIIANLRQLIAAADQYYLEYGTNHAKLADLVEHRIVKSPPESVAGEDYRTIRFEQGLPLLVKTTDGRVFRVSN